MKTISFFEYAKQKEVSICAIPHIINGKVYIPVSDKGVFKCTNV